MRKGMLKTIVCLTLSLFVSSVSAYAFFGRNGESKDGDLESKFFWRAGFLLQNSEEIGLTDDQVETIKNLKMDLQKNLIRKNAEIEILGLDIRSALKEEDVNQETVNSLIDQKYELKEQKTKDLVSAYLRLKNVLTEEQKAKKKELYSQKGLKKDSE